MKSNQSPTWESIFQNALPYYLDRVDLSALVGEEEGAGVLQTLVNGRLSRQVQPDQDVQERLRHIYFEARNFERTNGPKSFGLGYPLLLHTLHSELYVAPLFVWYLNLEPALRSPGAWVLKFDESHPILPNYLLIAQLEKTFQVELLDRMERLAFRRELNHKTLQELCGMLAATLGLENHTEQRLLMPAPGIDQIGDMAKKGVLYPAGVLGLFPPLSAQTPTSAPKPEEIFVPQVLPPEEADLSVHALPAFPAQATALHRVAHNKVSVVEGAALSGKTQVLANLLFNALLNGRKCLVVSNRIPALRSAQERLAAVGIHQLNFLLKDPLHDRKPLLEYLRIAAQGLGGASGPSEEEFQQKSNRYQREWRRLQSEYAAVKQRLFGAYDWTDTVGLFLGSHREEGKELLSSQLDGQEFQFDEKEYEYLKQAVLNSQPLYLQVQTLRHPLSDLNKDLFLKRSRTEALEYLQRELGRFLQKGSDLHHRFIQKVDAYAARLRDHYEEHYQCLRRQSDQVLETVAANTDRFGSEFLKSKGRKSWLPALFSQRRKQLRQACQQVRAALQKLLKEHQRFGYFDVPLPKAPHHLTMEQIKRWVEDFQKALLRWKGSIKNRVQDELLRLNSKTVHRDLDFQEQISELEYALDVLIEELNEAKLYQSPFSNKTLTIPQRQKYLESILERLETTRLNLRDFEPFYHWQAHWLQLSGIAQKVVEALIKVKPSDWMAAFESWYFDNLLAKRESPNLPTDDAHLNAFHQAHLALKPLLVPRIAASWEARQEKALKALRSAERKAFQRVFDKNNLKKSEGWPLELILEPAFEAVTDFLPILFTSVDIARQVLPRREAYFDLVIIDEAQCLSVEDACSVAPLGRRLVLFGMESLPGTETNALQYAIQSEVPVTRLVQRFKDLAARPKLHPVHQPSLDTHIEWLRRRLLVENVEGHFQERESTNDVEAQHIIRLLNQVQQTPQRTYPSVGIVTFTPEQRDKIAAYLLKLKQTNDPNSDKIRHLERNGLGVFYADELYGQYFDVLMVSFTFGSVNMRGHLSKKLHFFNTPQGRSLLRLVQGLSAAKTYLVHSFPEKSLRRFLSKADESGTCELARLLLFGQALQGGDKDAARKLMPPQLAPRQEEVPPFVFARQAAKYLEPYLPPERFHYGLALGQLPLPLLIAPQKEDGRPIALLPDGFFAWSLADSFVWENQMRRMLEEAGILCKPVWSLSWWKHPQQEARKLASFVIKQDQLVSAEKSASHPQTSENPEP